MSSTKVDTTDTIHATEEFADYQPITVREGVAIEAPDKKDSTVELDCVLFVLKWVFLYLPGAFAIHFVIMAFALFLADFSPVMLAGTFGIFAVGVFMVMFGLGKLSDLKYLKVVGALIGISALAGVIFAISTALTGGSFFGWFTILSFPFSLLIAHLVKRNINE